MWTSLNRVDVRLLLHVGELKKKKNQVSTIVHKFFFHFYFSFCVMNHFISSVLFLSWCSLEFHIWMHILFFLMVYTYKYICKLLGVLIFTLIRIYTRIYLMVSFFVWKLQFPCYSPPASRCNVKVEKEKFDKYVYIFI